MAKNFTVFYQLESMDCGATCLRMIARHYNRYYSLEYLRDLTYLGKQGVSLLSISDAAEQLGFKTLAVRTSLKRLQTDIPLPCIAHWEADHFVVIYRVSPKYVWIADPEVGSRKLTHAEFVASWAVEEAETIDEAEGVLLLLEPTPEFYDRDQDGVDRSRWTYVWSYLKPYRALIIQLFAGVLVAGLVQIGIPFLLKSLVDIGLGQANYSFINMMIIGLAFLFAVQLAVEVFRRWLLIHIGVRLNVNILSDFLIKLMHLPLRFFDNRLTGDLLQRISDHERIQRFLTSTTLFSLLSLFNFLAFSILLLLWSPWAFVIFLIGTALNFAWVYLMQTLQRDYNYKTFDQSAEHQSKLLELVDGMQDIKLHNAEHTKRWSWERTHAALVRTEIKAATYAQLQRTGSDVINEGKNLLILFFVAHAVAQGQMTLGMLLGIMYMVAQLNSPIRQFIEFMRESQDAKLSLERMNEIHGKGNEEDVSKKISMLPQAGELHVDNVRFHYNGPHSPVVLRHIKLVIPKGQTTAIVGSSGSGKSTLLKLMLNIYEPTEGTIRLGDVKLQHLQHKLYRERCGAVLQDGYIFNDTIARNIALGDEVIDQSRLLRAVRVANIQSFIESLPLGYGTRVGKEGLGLSLGEKQRLLIARAVYKDPEYLFLDEATSGLDSYTEMLIMENLIEAFRDRTIVIVAQRLNTVRLADQIVVLESGEVVEQGQHDELYYRG
ncbi:MAG: peptidase domain-containing ABC transporter, partial [Bacteroidetes bacterium]